MFSCSKVVYNIFIFHLVVYCSSKFINLLITPKAIETKPRPLFKVVKEPRVEVSSEELPTQENSKEVNASEEKREVVTFMDENYGHVDSRPSTMDSLRGVPFQGDTTLANFLSRPVELTTFKWEVGLPFPAVDLNPWEEFFTNPEVAKKIANYKLFSGDLHVKFVINGSPFHYGRLAIYYTPLNGYDDFKKLVPYSNDDRLNFILNSQKPHVFLNPTTSEGAELHLPFFWLQNALDIVGNDMFKMGTLTFQGLNNLKHANGANDPVTVTVFAWSPNACLGVPTSFTHDDAPAPFAAKQVNADEYGQGPVSKPASALANFASNFTSAPYIGPYAMATQIGANALSKVASIFGYSRTPILNTAIYRPQTKGSFSTSNMEDDVQKLSLDSKQELTIDTRTFGYSGEDELDIKSIASRQSYLTSFTWPVGATHNTDLFWSYAHPFQYGFKDKVEGVQYYLTAPAFAALPFNKWRGTTKFRFQIVCSNYHRGRLRIDWDPVDNATNASTNTRYTEIVDISQTTDFVVEIGWGQQTTFLSVDQLDTVPRYGAGTKPYTLSNTSWGTAANARLADVNGALRVSVLNELAVPNSTVNNDIEINVFVSMGDDFEVAQPDSASLGELRLFTRSDVTMPTAVVNKEVNAETEESVAQQDAPVDTNPDVKIAGSSSITDRTSVVHFGEVIHSFRPLLKRYCDHERIYSELETPDSGTVNVYSRPSHPFWVGFQRKVDDPGQVGDNMICNDVDGKPYVYGQTTLLNYVSSAFTGWRGSTRWYLDTTNIGAYLDYGDNLTVSRYKGESPYNISVPTDGWATDAEKALQNTFDYKTPGTDGFIHQSPRINPTVTFDVPYYSVTRFAPTRWIQNLSNNTTISEYGIWLDDPCDFMPSWLFRTFIVPKIGSGTEAIKTRIRTSVAAGDDYTLAFYQGPPPFYILK